MRGRGAIAAFKLPFKIVQAEAMRGAMEPEHDILFGPFRFDMTHGRLWRGEQMIALRPRTLAVLRYLAALPVAW